MKIKLKKESLIYIASSVASFAGLTLMLYLLDGRSSKGNEAWVTLGIVLFGSGAFYFISFIISLFKD